MSSTLPLLLSLADELESLTTQTYPDDFGLGFYPHRHYNRNASTPSIQLSLPAHNFLERPRTRRKSYDIKSNFINGIGTGHNIPGTSNRQYHRNNDFHVCMDVQDFKYNDLKVKITEDTIIVEGKHDEREDEHGLISRQFIRKYELPNGCDTNDAISTLSSDGILTIKIPNHNNKYCERNEKIIDIKKTGKIHKIDNDDNNGDDDDDDDDNGSQKDYYDDNNDDKNDPDKIYKCRD